MDPMTIGLLIGAGTGVLRGEAQKEEARAARAREAEVARWSPWTKMEPQRVGQPNMWDPIMQGALLGASFGKQFPAAGAEAAGSAPGTTPSPTGPYLTEEEYAAQAASQPKIGLPETTEANGWLPMSKPQYPQGYPSTQYPGMIEPMQSPWMMPTIYGPNPQ